MTQHLVIGCPVYKREWILPTWMDTVKTELKSVDVNATFVFVYDRSETSTAKLLWEICDGFPLWLVEGAAQSRDKEHKWVPEDFTRMVSLRNQLLRKVRDLDPDLFFSLDSDMLLRDGALSAMMDAVDSGYDAIGISTSMCHKRWCESWMYYSPTATTFARYGEPADFEGIKTVDAIMAGKLMTPQAYAIDYEFDVQGEDLGWCREVAKAGLKMGVCAKGAARHVMLKEDL